MSNSNEIQNLFQKRHPELIQKDYEILWTYFCTNNSKHIKTLNTNITTEFQKVFDYYNNLYGRYKKNNFKNDFEAFILWHLNQYLKCCYCGIEEKLLNRYFNKNTSNILKIKRNSRGYNLEFEHIINKYDECNFANLALSCYICNNAKSDFLSAKSFKPIAEGISKFWNGILNNDNTKTLDTFDNNSPIWQND